MRRQNKKRITYALAVIMLVSLITCMCAGVSADGNAKVSFRIEGDKECIYSGIEEIADGSTLKTLLEAVNTKASLEMVGLETNYVTSVKGISSAKYGGWDGWLYLVNGVVPADAIQDCKLKDGDEVVFFFGDPYGVGFQFPEIEIVGGKIALYSMDTEYDASYNPIVKKKAVASASVSIFDASGKEYKYVTDENGEIAVDEALLKPGSYKYKIEKYAANGLPLVLRSAEGASYTVESSPDTSDASALVMLLAIASFSALALLCVRKNRT